MSLYIFTVLLGRINRRFQRSGECITSMNASNKTMVGIGTDGLSNKSYVTTDKSSDDAVGVKKSEELHWFIAIVNNKSERACEAKLQSVNNSIGGGNIEVYLPTQQEFRVYKDGRRKKVERILLPALLFLHITETQRKEIVKLPFIFRFMTDRANSTGSLKRSKVAIVPDEQIETLKFMVGNADAPVAIESKPLIMGDKVRVCRGGLRGLEGNVVMVKDETNLVVDLGILGCARVTIKSSDLEKINE